MAETTKSLAKNDKTQLTEVISQPQWRGFSGASMSLSFRSWSGALAACSFVALLTAPTVGSATTLNAADALGTYQFSLSDAFGSGNFGSVTISTVSGSTVDIAVNVAPNFFLDTGSHELFSFSLGAGGTVDTSSLSGVGASHFAVQGPIAPDGNSPFGNFTWNITSDCTQGNCGSTNGQSFHFHVLNFAGIASATNQYNASDIWFASDVSEANCDTGCTGVVGAVLLPGGKQGDETPLPAAVWLMGSILGGGAGVGAWRRRKQRAKVA